MLNVGPYEGQSPPHMRSRRKATGCWRDDPLRQHYSIPPPPAEPDLRRVPEHSHRQRFQTRGTFAEDRAISLKKGSSIDVLDAIEL